jgi:membrane protein required for colicin V production
VILDAAVLALLAAASLLGALSGLIRPLFLFAGAALGWLAARHLSEPVGSVLARVISPGAARPVAAVLLFALVVAVVTLLGRRLARAPEGGGRPLDRGAGALLGGLAAAAAAWVGLVVADAAAPSLPASWQAGIARSDLAGLVRQNEVPGDWRRRAETALGKLLQVAGDPGAASRLAADPELRSLLDDPRVRTLVEEARQSGRAEAGRGEAARTQEGLKLLADPDFRQRLEAAQERLDRQNRPAR